ncbi:MAG: DNA topoisomerase III, partial [Clostridia bacterium]|nr:DNA topoisomerase III [Clostridia bacterium]
MKLIICEKPSVGLAVSSVLGAKTRHDGYMEGNGYLVSWCYGHLAELARADTYSENYRKWRYDDLPIVPQKWEYLIKEGKHLQFELLRALMSRTDITEVINACDAGREGELIFRTVYYLAGCTRTMKRLWISSMEEEAIRRGFEELRPGSEYDGLYQSALCRAKADWLVGVNGTRLFSILYHRKLNVGRVVSPTLALIVQRESEIAA